MRPRLHQIVWVLFAFVSIAAAPATAQTTDVPRVEISFGYQLLHVPDETFPLGFNLDISRAIGDGGLGFVAEVGASHDEQNEVGITGTLRFVNFGAGLRVSGRANPQLTPFVQIIAGGVHTNADRTVFGIPIRDSDTAFMLQPGGGVSIGFGGSFGIVGQADYRRVFFKEEGDNEFRIFAGARISIR